MNTARKVFNRLWNAIAPGTLNLTDDTGPVLRGQVSIGTMSVIDRLPIVQQFGFSSVPPAGSDVALLFLGGDKSNGAGVATNHQPTRPTGKLPGETMVYNAAGMQIYLTASGIVINSGGMPVVLNGDLRVTGEVTRGYGGADQVTLGQHKHPTGAAGSPTSAPTPGT